jgi:hypothetical protein
LEKCLSLDQLDTVLIKNLKDRKMRGVRLRDFQVNAIRNSFKESFLPEDHLWLFGSRADLTKRGGDIDLYVESYMKDALLVSKAKLKFLTKMHMAIGEQKIDVVVKFDETDLLIYKIAKEQGVQLV